MKNYILLLLLLSCASSSLVVGAEAGMEDVSHLGKRKTPGNGTASNSPSKKHKAEQKDDVQKWTVETIDKTFSSFSATFLAYIKKGITNLGDRKHYHENTADSFFCNGNIIPGELGDFDFGPIRRTKTSWYLFNEKLIGVAPDIHSFYRHCKSAVAALRRDDRSVQENKHFFCVYNLSKEHACIFDDDNDSPVSVKEFGELFFPSENSSSSYGVQGTLIEPPDWLKLHHLMKNGQIIEDS